MSAKPALGEPEDAITLHRKRVADLTGGVREPRFLLSAYLLARDFAAAADVIEAGLGLAPDDWKLISDRGEVKADWDDPDGALADCRRALELEPADLGPVYASAFLLEREGRLAEAECWRHIVEHSDARGGWELDAAGPTQELQRLQDSLA